MANPLRRMVSSSQVSSWMPQGAAASGSLFVPSRYIALVVDYLIIAGGGGGGSNRGAGGSGVVILRYPNVFTITLSAGLTGTTDEVGTNHTVCTITAGTGTVSWS